MIQELMKRHYRVRFNHKGTRHYGTVYPYGKKAEQFAKENKFMVEDAIFPTTWIIKEPDMIDVPLGRGKDDEYETYVDREFQKARELSESLTGCVPGKLVHFRVADGYAYYVIARVTKQYAYLDWRGFCLDRYTEPILGWGGKLSKKQCEAFIRVDEMSLQELGENHENYKEA